MPLQSVYDIPWLDANATRNYPLDDRATKLDDNGKTLPDALLADLNLWFASPDGLVNHTAYVSAAAITAGLVTITFNRSDGTPLAAVTVPKPVDPGRNYRLQAFSDGSGGWVIFGPDINNLSSATYRFGGSSQSLILPRLTRAYPVLGVSSIGRPSMLQKLRGVVQLQSTDPNLLVIESGREKIEGVENVECVIFRLNTEKSGVEILKDLQGPCGGSAETNSCQRENPIWNINGVTPCCSDGLITVKISEEGVNPVNSDLSISYCNAVPIGPATALDSYPFGNTLTLDYNVGLSDICPTGGGNIDGVPRDACDNEPLCDEWWDESAVPVECFTEAQGPWYEANGDTLIHYSRTFQIDLENVSGIRIEGASAGFLALMGASDSISVGVSGSGHPQYTFPAHSVLFENNQGFLIARGGTLMTEDGVVTLPPTNNKSVVHGLLGTTLYAQGTELLHGTGSVSQVYNSGVPNAERKFRQLGTYLTREDLLEIAGDGDLRFGHLTSHVGRFDIRVICYPRYSRVTNEQGDIDKAIAANNQIRYYHIILRP